MKPVCCGKEANIQPDNNNGVDGFGVWCSVCNHAIFDADKDKAIEMFMEGANTRPPKQLKKEPVQMNKIVPVSKNNLVQVFESKQNNLSLEVLPLLEGSMTNFKRLMNNNTERYPMSLKGKSWDKVWNTEEGKQSIIYGIEEATMMGATLGKMGDLVPMGNSCTFIPSVEAFEFALTNGNNAPFEWIMIECIYENDEYSSGSKMGSFFFENKHGIPRGSVVGAVAYGKVRKRGIVIGEIYDGERLMEKALAHSTSYQYYLRDKKQFEALKSEGKTSFKNGREYFQKDMGTWKKDVYEDELSNPYDSDRAEMFRKAVGKSFFGKFIKVRNSEAAMHEVNNNSEAVEECLNMADSQFEEVE